jgi:hypothetical protein
VRNSVEEHLRSHLTDGQWHDGCRHCQERRIHGGTGVSQQDMPVTRPYSAPGMPLGAAERAREIAETMPTVGQWPGPDHSPGAAGVLPDITCTTPGHCDGDNAPNLSSEVDRG